MTHIPPKGATVNLWIVYSHDSDGTFLEGIYTHSVQAEAAKRELEQQPQPRGYHIRYSIVERTTQPHGEGQ